jgi:hypothetical protein
MSDSSRVQLAYLRETSWGVTPAAPLKALRYTRESFARRFETVRSDEVREDRQVSDITRIGAGVQGGFEFEFSHTSFDEILEAAFGNFFSAPLEIVSTGISVNSGTQSFVGSGLPIFSPGQWIWATRTPSHPNNDGYFQVVSSTSTNLTVANGTTALVTETAGASIKITASSIVNGTAKMSFTVEKRFADIGVFWPFTGMRLNTIDLRIASRAKITGSAEFVGGQGERMLAATVGTGAYVAAPTTSIMNASNNVGQVLENGSPLGAAAAIKAMTIRISNNLGPQDAVGSVNPIGVRYGNLIVTGSMQVYFQDQALFNRFNDGIDSSIATVLQQPTPENDAYALTFPRIEFTNGDVVGVGNNDDVLANMEWEAKLSPVTGYTMRLDSFI